MPKTTVSKSRKVILRKKKTKKGFSLYLDYTKNRKRIREFLGLYISGNKRLTQNDHENLDLAEKIKARRILELQAMNLDDPSILPKPKDFINWYKEMISKKQIKPSSMKKWKNLTYHLMNYSGGDLFFSEVTPAWLEDFRKYLLAKLKRNTADTYFSTMKAALNKALNDDIIVKNPFNKVEPIGRDRPLPKYLTEEELSMLIKQPWETNVKVRNAFLFSCYTGLRYGDITRITWKNIIKNNGRNYIDVVQMKTSYEELIPLSENAKKYLPEKIHENQRLFPLSHYENTNRTLNRWAKKAGLKKRISYHVSRHTFATLLLSNGVDIYTVSKLLGHTDIKHTQIYARVIDKKKEEAVDLLPEL